MPQVQKKIRWPDLKRFGAILKINEGGDRPLLTLQVVHKPLFALSLGYESAEALAHLKFTMFRDLPMEKACEIIPTNNLRLKIMARGDKFVSFNKQVTTKQLEKIFPEFDSRRDISLVDRRDIVFMEKEDVPQNIETPEFALR